MDEGIKISGVIITYNEEVNIRSCIQSLKGVCDEIIVVDSYSNDKTAQIVKDEGAVFIQNSFKGHIEQKNFAMNQSKYDWVLSLDADEQLSKGLISAIKLIKSKTPTVSAFKFNRLNNYCGQWIKYCGWYPDKKIRLWDKNMGNWGGVNPHDTVVTGGKVKEIEQDILHFSYKTIEDHINQINKFSTIAAQEDLKRGKKTNIFIHLVLYPFFNFLKNYFIRLGFLDGYYGYLVCRNGAFYRYLKYVKLRRLHQNS